MKEAGAYQAGEALHPSSTATTVRVRNGKIVTTDGPFAETKEQLGGYYVVECKNLDEAIQWAAKIPHASIASDRNPADRRLQSGGERVKGGYLMEYLFLIYTDEQRMAQISSDQAKSAIAHHWDIIDEASAKGVFERRSPLDAIRHGRNCTVAGRSSYRDRRPIH